MKGYTVTKEEFERYESIKATGKIQMSSLNAVSALTGLSKEQCLYIMGNFELFKKKYSH